MSQINDYNAELPNMIAIPANIVKTPNFPTDKEIQEAEDLTQTVLKYKAEITAVDLQESNITLLSIRASALKEAQSR